MYSVVIQLYIYICSLFVNFFSHIDYYRILRIVLCAVIVGPCWLSVNIC